MNAGPLLRTSAVNAYVVVPNYSTELRSIDLDMVDNAIDSGTSAAGDVRWKNTELKFCVRRSMSRDATMQPSARFFPW